MIVESRCGACRVEALYVGIENVRRYFPRSLRAVDLCFDHLRIQCALEPDFWIGRPEIRDVRVLDWLELKRRVSGTRSQPMILVPDGERGFVLKEMRIVAGSLIRPFAISDWV